MATFSFNSDFRQDSLTSGRYWSLMKSLISCGRPKRSSRRTRIASTVASSSIARVKVAHTMPAKVV